jgi:hypothetical protein
MEEPVRYNVKGRVLPEKTYEKLAEITDIDIQSAVKKSSDVLKDYIGAKSKSVEGNK